MSSSLAIPKTFAVPTQPAPAHGGDDHRLVPTPDSLEFRSEMVARIAARMHEIPTDTATFLCNPTMVRQVPREPDTLCDLVLELIKSSEVNEAHNTTTAERDLLVGTGVSKCLRWIHDFRNEFDESFVERLALKCLVPMYLAAGHGRVGSSLTDSLSMIRIACSLFELDRITSNHDLAAWLQNSNPNLDPCTSIPKSFRVCLELMAFTFWSEVHKKNINSTSAPFRLVDPRKSQNKLHGAWWSLACQLSERKSHIAVPAEVAAGVIAWDKLLDHWEQVKAALSGSADGDTTLLNKEAPAGANRNASKVPETGQQTAAATSTAKGNSKFDFANDNRFVEIRSSKDPHLSTILEQILMQCRNDQGMLSLIVVKKLGQNTNATAANQILQNWQARFIQHMDQRGESANVRGFVSDEGELSLVFQDVERSELAQWVRDSFAKLSQTNDNSQLATPTSIPLVAGISTVNAPSRSFKIEQLIQSAWRCLDGASSQGSGAVKTIEVY